MSFTIKNRFSKIITFAEKPPFFAGILPESYEKCFAEAFSPFLKCEKFYSLRNDLTKSPSELLSSFKANTRNEIRKGEREQLCCCFDIDIDVIIDLHLKMAAEKGMDNGDITREYRSLKPFLFGTCVKLNSDILAAHTFICSPEKKVVMLKTSASAFRTLPKEQQKLIGVANRYLHYKEMLYFQQKGFLWYDFGGWAENISNDDPRYAINNFKKGFCGEKTAYYNYKSFSYLFMQYIFKCFFNNRA